MPNCAIVNCKNSSKLVDCMNGEVSFHRFPTDLDVQQKWIEATGNGLLWFPKKHSTICSIHFTEEDYVVTKQFRRLKKTAYPTLQILEENIHQQSSTITTTTNEKTVNNMNNHQESDSNKVMQANVPQKRKFEENVNQPSPESSDTEAPNKQSHTSAERSMALKVLRFFEQEKKLGTFTLPVSQALARASAATGLPKDTIKAIKDEANKQEVKKIAVPQIVNRTRQGTKKLPISEADVKALKDVIISFYSTYNEMPTLQKVFNIAKKDLNFPGQKESFRKLLIHQLGCSFKRCLDSNFIITMPGQKSNGVQFRFPSKIIPIPIGSLEPADVARNVTTMIPLVSAELGEDDTTSPVEESDSND